MLRLVQLAWLTLAQALPRADALPAPLQVTRAELAPWFDAPELASALARYHRGDNLGAAAAFEKFATSLPADPRGEPARFLALLSRHDAGDCEGVAPALEALAETWPELADHAWTYAGSCWAKLGQHQRAVDTLDRVRPSAVSAERAIELATRAFVALGRRPEAILRLATWLHLAPADRIDPWKLLRELVREVGDPASLARVEHEIAWRFPRLPSGKAARAALGGAAKLTPSELLAIARQHVEAQDHSTALRALDAALGAHDKGTEGHCAALRMQARTHEKMKHYGPAWTRWERALACSGEALADATFAGGRNRLRVGSFASAERLLRQHLALFPERSTADDAALLLAETLREAGRAGEADVVLWESIVAWPDGDQADEAAWGILWPSIEAGRWADVVETAGRLSGYLARERHYGAEGRTRYWRGRALAKLGRWADAKDDWATVMREYPLSWYAVCAYSRLRAIDRWRAAEALGAAQAAVPGSEGALEIPGRLGADPRFRTAVALARLGLGESARREISRLSTRPDPGEDEEAWSWALIEVLALAGADVEATRLARAEEPRFGAHWPAGGWRQPWELAHPAPYSDLVSRWARAHGPIDRWWVYAIMREESGFNPRVESWANAIGLMQIILPTAQILAKGTEIRPTRANLQRPEVAIQLGTKYLAKLLAQHRLVPLASAGYNAGGGAVSKWRRERGELDLDEFVERIPYAEARGYAKRVTRSLARYTWLYEGRHLSLPMGPVGAPVP